MLAVHYVLLHLTVYYSTGKNRLVFSFPTFQSVILLQYSHAELTILLILLSSIKLINYATHQNKRNLQYRLFKTNCRFNSCIIYIIPVKKTELTAKGIRCADHATPSIRKIWH
jgi:hypothetical protein